MIFPNVLEFIVFAEESEREQLGKGRFVQMAGGVVYCILLTVVYCIFSWSHLLPPHLFSCISSISQRLISIDAKSFRLVALILFPLRLFVCLSIFLVIFFFIFFNSSIFFFFCYFFLSFFLSFFIYLFIYLFISLVFLIFLFISNIFFLSVTF